VIAADKPRLSEVFSGPLMRVERTLDCALQMSDNDPKRTCSDCGPMSAFGVIADINGGTTPALSSYEGEGMSDDRTKADKAWEARQEAARYRIFNAATNAAEATDEADDEKYFAVLDQAGKAAEAAAAGITGYKTYADLLEALDTRRKQS